jgi:hypothetical protein
MERAPGVNTSSHSFDNILECTWPRIGFAFRAQWG